MENMKEDFSNIDEYISHFPGEVQKKLQEMRAAVREIAPDAVEKISYQMPTFYLNGNLVHFAAFKNHIGFYPAPSGIEAFEQELKSYKSSKGAVQFPLSQPLPMDLIRRIIEFRAEENRRKPAKKK